MKNIFRLFLICAISSSIAYAHKVESLNPNQENAMKITKEYIQNFYNDILVNQKIEKFGDYFTDDCFISINGKVFNADSFKQRMKWIRENTKSVHVEVVNFFVSSYGKQITD